MSIICGCRNRHLAEGKRPGVEKGLSVPGRADKPMVCLNGLRLIADRHAVTAVEYGIVAAFLCLSLLAIFSRFGTTVSSLFTTATSGV